MTRIEKWRQILYQLSCEEEEVRKQLTTIRRQKRTVARHITDELTASYQLELPL